VNFKKNVSLKNYTTFKIGGPAKYFYIAKNKTELIEAIKQAKKLKLPFFNSERSEESKFCQRQVFILGGGSNLLVSDKGFNGLVIKFGQPLSSYVSKGLEWAVGIPGTVQGAACSNAGAFKKSMKDVVESVEVFDTETGKVKIFKNKDCKFGYRDSIFRKKKNLIILSVEIKPKKSNTKKIRTSLRENLDFSLRSKIKQYLDYRKQTQPLNFPSAGSIFKNLPGKSAGELVEKCGLKGKKIGNVKISEKHANFIVNLGQGKAKDVIKLIKLIKKEVKKKFGVVLEEEIQFLGF